MGGQVLSARGGPQVREEQTRIEQRALAVLATGWSRLDDGAGDRDVG